MTSSSQKSAQEYADSVRQWLTQYYSWCHFQSFVALNQYQTFAHHVPIQSQQQEQQQQQQQQNDFLPQNLINRIINQAVAHGNPPDGAAARPNIPVNQVRHATVIRVGQGRCYKVPQLHQRFLAEVVDFILLFVLKVIVTYLASEYFDLIDINRYDLETLVDSASEPDFKTALEITSDIMVLELLHRIVVCIYETVCLQKGAMNVGGATPGKTIMGIKVVYCTSVVELPNGYVMVQPATDLGWTWSFFRAVIKNFSMAFCFPVCFTILFNRHYRAAYDIVANAIVVSARERHPSGANRDR